MNMWCRCHRMSWWSISKGLRSCLQSCHCLSRPWINLISIWDISNSSPTFSSTNWIRKVPINSITSKSRNFVNSTSHLLLSTRTSLFINSPTCPRNGHDVDSFPMSISRISLVSMIRGMMIWNSWRHLPQLS